MVFDNGVRQWCSATVFGNYSMAVAARGSAATSDPGSATPSSAVYRARPLQRATETLLTR
jgi:hypothetical protein